MSKIIACPNSKEELNKIVSIDIDAILLSIENLSVNSHYYIDINTLQDVLPKLNNKEVFVSLNKLMKNKDINYLKETLIKLDKLNIQGVLFYDLAVLELAKEINFTKNLVVAQNHSNCSLYSNNYFNNLGVTYALLSSEITLEEVYEIKKGTNMKIIIPAYGHLPMAYSNRHLLTSYFDYIKKDKDNDYYYIKDNDNYHIVKEEKEGTSIYNSHILDLDCELKAINENNIDYVLLYHEFISEENYAKALQKYIDIRNLKKFEFKDNYKGFSYTKTIYKVGNNNDK